MRNAEHYRNWVQARGIRGLPMPDRRGLFPVGRTWRILPWIHAWYTPEAPDQIPPWEPENWEGALGGFRRWLRADQILDWHLYAAKGMGPEKFATSLRAVLLGHWLLGIDAVDAVHLEDADHRTLAVPLTMDRGRVIWKRNAPAAMLDVMRQHFAGVDPVHTREDEGAELSRRLAVGWTIGSDGRLLASSDASSLGPATRLNPHYRSVRPRRMMLGAAILTQAVPLVAQSSPGAAKAGPIEKARAASLHMSFDTADGWTHEDAFVVSEEAARKLNTDEVLDLMVPIPATASRIRVRPRGWVKSGTDLVCAWIDAFAMGLDVAHCAVQDGVRRREVSVGADGWVQLHLDGATAPADGWLQARRVLRRDGGNSRAVVQLRFLVCRPLEIGDKLGTPHGLKGVVSAIRPAAQMPVVQGKPVEILTSPAGIESRLALGQLHEMGIDVEALSTRIASPATVVRLPHHSREKLGVTGNEWHGVKYGWMEFTALMAHRAEPIAHELLSFERCDSAWLREERRLGATTSQAAACRAANRFLEFFKMLDAAGEPLGARFEGAALVADRKRPAATMVDARVVDTDFLGDVRRFRVPGGLAIGLPRPIELPVRPLRAKEKKREASRPRRGVASLETAIPLYLTEVPILPPWLRPASSGRKHPITRCYEQVAGAIRRREDVTPSLRRLAAALLDDSSGVCGFFKACVFERRLTYSATGVIVPKPRLRIDQVALPRTVLDGLQRDIAPECREVVLVGRYPTLHRYGLIALRPVPSDDDAAIGLPLGVLSAMGADFDGDLAIIVALRTREAVHDAVRLIPGSPELRRHPFRTRERAAFALSRELSDPTAEDALAVEDQCGDEDWRTRHAQLQAARIGAVTEMSLGGLREKIERARSQDSTAASDALYHALWQGLPEAEWLELAAQEMRIVYRAQSRKGSHGGFLKRLRHHIPWDGDMVTFATRLSALQTLTERLTQVALDVKTGDGRVGFDPKRFFRSPGSHRDMLWELDPASEGDAGPPDTGDDASLRGEAAVLDHAGILENVAKMSKPQGMREFFAGPTRARLQREILRLQKSPERAQAPDYPGDPRVDWFLGPMHESSV